MVASFGLHNGGRPDRPRFPHNRLVEHNNRLDVFELYREGLPTGRMLRIGSHRAGHTPEVLELRSHAMLASPVFGCPRCGRDCYRLHERLPTSWDRRPKPHALFAPPLEGRGTPICPAAEVSS